MRQMFGSIDFPEELIRRGRAGYYGLVTYLDEKIGRLIKALKKTGQLENTVVIHTSDHGEMNGEHAMWRKSNFYEASSRIPLQIAWPRMLPRKCQINEVVSLVDLVATIVDLAGAPGIEDLDGESLTALIKGGEKGWKNEAFSEYLAHGVTWPMAMLRRGDFKFNTSLGDPPELYNLVQDPGEFNDLAGNPVYREILEDFQLQMQKRWNPEFLDQQVRQSQKERRLIEVATRVRNQ